MGKDRNKLTHRWLCLSLLQAMLGPTMFGSSSEVHPMTPVSPQAMIQTITVPYEGVNRPVSPYVPTGYRAGTAVPLVFALHGGGGMLRSCMLRITASLSMPRGRASSPSSLMDCPDRARRQTA